MHVEMYIYIYIYIYLFVYFSYNSGAGDFRVRTVRVTLVNAVP